MSEIPRILDQMDRVFAGDLWHGPSLMRLLEGISAEDASKHSIDGAHSIWEFVNHIAAWYRMAQYELTGEKLEVTSERDWPPVWEASEIAWKRSVENLTDSRTRLRKVVETLRDDQLEEKPQGIQHSRYVILHGVIQHDLYHAGQIALLRKALG